MSDSTGLPKYARAASKPLDPQRPSAPLRPVAGREDAARVCDRALRTLLTFAHDERMEQEIRRALIAAGVVEVERSEEQ